MNTLENQHMIKHFINILHTMSVFIKLEHLDGKVIIKDIGFTEQFYTEYNVINNPKFEIDNELFFVSINTPIKFQKDNICSFEKEALKRNPYLQSDAIDSIYIDYQDEMNEQEKDFTLQIVNEININLKYLKQAIDKYLEELNNGSA